MKLPFVSIIVLTYNGMDFLKDCFTSLGKINYPKNKYEVIMVDNASKDNSVNYARENFPWVRILPLDKNYGFAEGNNKGVKVARGKYIVFLNQDTIVDENWLIELVKAALKDKKVGICGSLIVDFYDRSIQSALNFMDYFGNVIHKKHAISGESFYVSGCSLLIRRGVINKLKYCFDPSYFLYFEDVDLCWRVKLLGYKVVVVSSSVVYHKHKHKLNMENVKSIDILRTTVNKIVSFRKNLRSPLKQVILLFVLVRTFFAVIFWKVKGRWHFGLRFLNSLFFPVNRDIDLKRIPLKEQIKLLSIPNLKEMIRSLKF